MKEAIGLVLALVVLVLLTFCTGGTPPGPYGSED